MMTADRRISHSANSNWLQKEIAPVQPNFLCFESLTV